MPADVYHYAFAPDTSIEEIEESLLLALFAVESLRGEDQTRLDASFRLDKEKRVCVIDAGTAVGRDLARIFAGFLRRQFGHDAFQVDRVTAEQRASA